MLVTLAFQKLAPQVHNATAGELNVDKIGTFADSFSAIFF